MCVHVYMLMCLPMCMSMYECGSFVCMCVHLCMYVVICVYKYVFELANVLCMACVYTHGCLS